MWTGQGDRASAVTEQLTSYMHHNVGEESLGLSKVKNVRGQRIKMSGVRNQDA